MENNNDIMNEIKYKYMSDFEYFYNDYIKTPFPKLPLNKLIISVGKPKPFDFGVIKYNTNKESINFIPYIFIAINNKTFFINKEEYNKYKKFMKDKEKEFENNACNIFNTKSYKSEPFTITFKEPFYNNNIINDRYITYADISSKKDKSSINCFIKNRNIIKDVYHKDCFKPITNDYLKDIIYDTCKTNKNKK